MNLKPLNEESYYRASSIDSLSYYNLDYGSCYCCYLSGAGFAYFSNYEILVAH